MMQISGAPGIYVIPIDPRKLAVDREFHDALEEAGGIADRFKAQSHAFSAARRYVAALLALEDDGRSLPVGAHPEQRLWRDVLRTLFALGFLDINPDDQA